MPPLFGLHGLLPGVHSYPLGIRLQLFLVHIGCLFPELLLGLRELLVLDAILYKLYKWDILL
jgi:hypothetical protein